MAHIGMSFTDEDLASTGDGDFSPLPAGEYSVTIDGADLKQTKAGDGTYINLKMIVDGPTHMGRIVFSMLNIQNPSQKSEAIGRGQLGDILRILGIQAATFEDTDQLLGGQMLVKLAVKDAVYVTDERGNKVEKYKAGNDVKAYKPLTCGSPAQAPVPRQPAPAPQRQATAAPAAKSPPWARK